MLLFSKMSVQALGQTSLVFDGYRGSFAQLKRLGRKVNHPPVSSAEVKN
jgi:hypothetical protein